ncbi:Transcription factor A, mitochondrial [Vanrija pseudolonga]|uniref:Transcription factor A, mitochondrial n=1 Tax=Vanrija pseudolonga TaxID=143232 RepID=A0AAF0Y9W6_9TREE|nr:Transcription factor A, mitochondrial [Vanrija pseudolonga]
MASILLSRSFKALTLAEPASLRALSTSAPALKATAAAPKAKAAAKPKKKQDRTKSIPAPPKRPNSPFTIFFKGFYHREKGSFLDAQGKTNVADVARAAGKAWAALSEAERKSYDGEVKAEWTAYNAAMKSYLETLPAADRLALEKKAGKKFPVPGGRSAAKQAIRDRPGNPGRASSPFFEYLQAQRDVIQVEHADELKGLKPMEINLRVVSLAARKWHTLTPNELQKWKDECQRKRELYKAWVETQPDKEKLLKNL